jgi:hypothetical protein
VDDPRGNVRGHHVGVVVREPLAFGLGDDPLSPGRDIVRDGNVVDAVDAVDAM